MDEAMRTRSVQVDDDLYEKWDELARAGGFRSRSDYLRDHLRHPDTTREVARWLLKLYDRTNDRGVLVILPDERIEIKAVLRKEKLL